LRAGVDPAVTMKILNSVLLLKNGEEWGYSTVDLMCVDLFTGETCFYKYGAAPSFVKNGKTIRCVRCESLAAGICAGDGSAPDIIQNEAKAWQCSAHRKRWRAGGKQRRVTSENAT